MNWAAFAILTLLAITGCSDSPEASLEDDESEISQTFVGSDDQVVAEGNEETKAGETFDEYDARRDSYAGTRGESHGDGCTVNCGGHNAGYEWARDKGVTSADECGGTSWSFKEGCMAFAEENGG